MEIKTEVLTEDDVRRIVAEQLSSMRIYVLESDITDAQQRVKTIIEESTF